MNQNRAPLYEALINHSKKERYSFHVPGHKNGQTFCDLGVSHFKEILQIDATELQGLDDLHAASGVIKDAQELAALLYHSKQCFFLVGGSTAGNMAMIMATCKEGDKVIVQRNSHKSVFNALNLAKVQPVFVEPSFDTEAQLATTIDETELIQTLQKHQDAKALIVTNPNYYGYTVNLEAIIKKAHQFNIAVLVDEAHGAHFGHHSTVFPKSAIEQGADIVVQSAHKTLPAMTMASYLHYNSNLVSLDQLQYYLQLFQSSSPSYPLMASLDLARHYLANLDERLLANYINQINDFKQQLASIKQIKVINNKKYIIDPLKLTIQSQCELSGYELQQLLEKNGIFTELADRYNVLFVFSLSLQDHLQQVYELMKSILQVYVVKPTTFSESKKNVTTSQLALSYDKMAQLDTEIVNINYSWDKIIAENIVPYPPGIPLLLTGERITKTMLTELSQLKKAGAIFQGDRDFFREGIKVFKY